MLLKKTTIILSILLFGVLFSCNSKKEEKSKQIKKEPTKKEKTQPLNKDITTKTDNSSLPDTIVHNPFLKLKFDEVIAYDYETHMDSEQPYIFSNDGKLNPTVTQKKVLTREQISTLKTFLGSTETYGHTRADCFEPHLGIVFYKNKKVVEHISICISCNHLVSSIEIPATSFKTYTYQSDKTMKFPMDGFSPKAKQFLFDFCQSLGFSYCKN